MGDGLWDLKAAQELDISFLGIGTKNREAMLDNGCKNWVEDYKSFDLNSLK